MKTTEQRLKEVYENIKSDIENGSYTKELSSMCKPCEYYCGLDHDYEECKEFACFNFWLATVYLRWSSSF